MRGPDITMQDRARGLLLGGAIGDAMGAPVEFVQDPRQLDHQMRSAPPLDLPSRLVTDDTQMTLFTAEALIRTQVRGLTKGIASLDDVTYLAYLRWLRTQNGSAAGSGGPQLDDGWLLAQPELWQRRAPGNTCLGSLQSGGHGTLDQRINNSKGCGGVMRTAPIGLVQAPGRAYEFGCTNAALTHGHDDGIAPAGLLAELVSVLCTGADLFDAIESVVEFALTQPIASGTVELIYKAMVLGNRKRGFTRDNLTAELGEGWVGHEALAIGIACAIAHADDAGRAIWVAANHCGDSDSTASITGQILGATHGVQALPARWAAQVELRGAIVRLADVLATIPDGTFHPEVLWADFPGV